VSVASAQSRRALLTGITGQDGSFLAELLLERGYEVTGVVRGSRPAPRTRTHEAAIAADDVDGVDVERSSLGCSEHLRTQVELVRGDLLEPETLRAAIERVRPHEIYHLAAPSVVYASWERPAETVYAISGAAAAIIETVRELTPSTRVFVSASGAIFGDAGVSPQSEDTPCRPTSPYAVAKLAAHQLVGLLRARYDLHVSSGIVFNHESTRRPEDFVSRKITRAAAAISLGLQPELTLGNLQAVRDWSFAGDIMRGAWLMLQQERPDDYVLASGVAHTVEDFVRVAFDCVGLDPKRHVRVDPTLVHSEGTPSVGDPSKARTRLGWEPRVDFQQLVEHMVEADLRELRGVTATP
jgi:GDPmannose 4,6-dehydratase